MRTTVHDGVTTVVVSRRNLWALLAKLDGNPPNSACTLVGPSRYPTTVLQAEEDDVHYAHPSREGEPAGRMQDQTEAQL